MVSRKFYLLPEIALTFLLFIFYADLIKPATAAGQTIEYGTGLLKLLEEDGKESTTICMVYPSDYYKLDSTAHKSFNLSYDKTIDICDKNLTKDDFVPSKSNALIVLSTSTMNCSITPYINFIREGKSLGVIILSNNTFRLNESYGWDVFSVVQRENIDKFRNSTSQHEAWQVQLFGLQKFDASLILLWLIAVICVAVGSFTGPYRLLSNSITTDTEQDQEALRDERKQEANEARVVDGVTVPIAVGFVILISTTLLLLYFFYQYLVFFFIAIFCIASPCAMYALILQIIHFMKPGIRCPGVWRFGIHEIFIAALTITFPIVWFIFRHSDWVWWIQDLLGVCFCIHLIQTLHLPNMKVITIILVLLFIYDIFFVFITPYFTNNGKSVMIEVATGVSDSGSNEQLPMLLRFPRFQANPVNICTGGRDFSLLGYGDIIIPGFLVCYAHGFDLHYAVKYRAYFITSLIAYAIGLGGALVALLLTSSGQPALFYIVPSILLGIYTVGLIRREVKALWRGSDRTEPQFEQESA